MAKDNEKEKATKKKRGKTAAIVGGTFLAGVGAAAAGAAIAAKVVSKRDQRKEDPFKDTPYGTLPHAETETIEAADGTKIHVEVAGKGPAIVFTHGFSLNAGTWFHQFDHLASDYKLVAWDIRGHGRSAASQSDYTLPTMASDLARVIEFAAEDQPVVLVGHSMGGMVTAQLLVDNPEMITSGKVKAVVLANTGMGDIMGGLFRFGSPAVRTALRPFLAVGYERLGRNPVNIDRVRARGTDLHYVWARLMGFGPQPSHRHVRFVREMLDVVETEVWVEVLQSIVGLELRPQLGTISVPVLVVVGTHDRITPLPVAESLTRRLPQARLEIIDGAGHCPMLEKHDIFNELLTDFLKETA